VRFLVAVAGVLLSLPLLLFFGVGSITFLNPLEKTFASLTVLFALGLFGLSILAIFKRNLAMANLIALAAAILLVVAVWIYVEMTPR
jgi:hypothetical protein